MRNGNNTGNQTPSKPPIPPRLALWILRQMVDHDIRDRVMGDLEEVFRSISHDSGRLRANGWYWKQVIRSMPLFVCDSVFWRWIMFWSYVKIAFRNLHKYRGYALINIAGLAVGMAAGLFFSPNLVCKFRLSYIHRHRTFYDGNSSGFIYRRADGQLSDDQSGDR